jgi:hypothetical protein
MDNEKQDSLSGLFAGIEPVGLPTSTPSFWKYLMALTFSPAKLVADIPNATTTNNTKRFIIPKILIC